MAGLDSLAGEDVTVWSDSEVRHGLLALLRAHHQLSALVSAVVASFDTRGLADQDGYRTTRSWLVGFGWMSQGAATGWLRRGRLQRDLPDLAAAARAGDVSPEQLRLVDDLATKLGTEQVQPFDAILAEVATAAGPREVGAVCDRIRAVVDPDGPEPDPHAHERRELTLSRQGSLVQLRGQLDLEGAAVVHTALDAWLAPPAPGDPRTAAQRRADALVELLRQALTHGQVPTVGGVRPHLGLLLTPDTLQRLRGTATDPATDRPGEPVTDPATPADPLVGLPPGPEPPWLNGVGTIPATTAQRLACDSHVWRVVLDPTTGLPLDVGRTHRLVPHWIRKALHARDRGCRWPGCQAPAAWTDGHHLLAWYHDGDTNIDNLILLCRHHHMRVHEGGWAAHLDPATGDVTVARPDGTPYELGPSHPWRPATADPPLRIWA